MIAKSWSDAKSVERNPVCRRPRVWGRLPSTMGIVIQTIATYAPWIYAVCGLAALYQLYRIWQVRAERKQAVFSLEREKAIQDTYSIFAVALALVLIMGFTYFLSNTLAQAVEPLVAESLSPTPALPFMPTPTNTPLPVTPTPTWTPTPLGSNNAPPPEPPTPIPVAVEAAPTPTPVPVVVAPVCPDNRARLLRPGENEVVSGVVNVIGTATHESFQYYKLEAAPGAGASGGFNYVGGGNNPVVNNFLMGLDTFGLGNGVWSLRLIVVDQTGNFPPPCQVTIIVQN